MKRNMIIKGFCVVFKSYRLRHRCCLAVQRVARGRELLPSPGHAALHLLLCEKEVTFVALCKMLRVLRSLPTLLPKTCKRLGLFSAVRRQYPKMIFLSSNERWFSSDSTSKSNSNVDGNKVASEEVGGNNSGNSNENSKDRQDLVRMNEDEYDDYEYQEPRTAAQKVRYYLLSFFQIGLLVLGGLGMFYTAKELFPGRLGPTHLYGEVFELLRHNNEVSRIVGDNMHAYGDMGSRNRDVISKKYTGPDGSLRLRIKFNIKGSKGAIKVWAEVSDKIAAHEYVYIICQDSRNGRVFTIVDIRERTDAAAVDAGLSAEGNNALNALLNGNKHK